MLIISFAASNFLDSVSSVAPSGISILTGTRGSRWNRTAHLNFGRPRKATSTNRAENQRAYSFWASLDWEAVERPLWAIEPPKVGSSTFGNYGIVPKIT